MRERQRILDGILEIVKRDMVSVKKHGQAHYEFKCYHKDQYRTCVIQKRFIAGGRIKTEVMVDNIDAYSTNHDLSIIGFVELFNDYDMNTFEKQRQGVEDYVKGI